MPGSRRAGSVPREPVPVVLSEKVGGQLVERGRATVTPDPRGNRVPVTVRHTPIEAGEKTFVLAVPTVAGETDATNNRLERTVLVTDSKRVRVLYVEGYPRYDFRFVKVLLERESERSVGGKGIEVKVILLNAAKGWEGTDRSALGAGRTPDPRGTLRLRRGRAGRRGPEATSARRTAPCRTSPTSST